MNGRRFRESVLQVGDRLGFGPVEFEVLATLIPVPPVPPPMPPAELAPPPDPMEPSDWTNPSLMRPRELLSPADPRSSSLGSPVVLREIEKLQQQIGELKERLNSAEQELGTLSERLQSSTGNTECEIRRLRESAKGNHENLARLIDSLRGEFLQTVDHSTVPAADTDTVTPPTEVRVEPACDRPPAAPDEQPAVARSPRSELSWLAQQFAAADAQQNHLLLERASGEPRQALPARDDKPRDQAGSLAAASAGGRTEQGSASSTAIDVFDRLARVGIWREAENIPAIQPLTARHPSLPENTASEGMSGDHVRQEIPPSLPAPKPGDEGQPGPIRYPASLAQVDSLASPSAESVDPGVPVPGPGAKTVAEDDTIESYMERLLKRVRGTPLVGSTLDSPSPAEADSSELLADFEPDSGEYLDVESMATEPQPLTEEEYIPRSQAPELDANLAAMRELANTSRHNNILSHARRTWSAQSKAKLIGAIVGLAISTAAAFFIDTHPTVAGIGLAAGISMTSVLGWQAVSFRRKLFGSLSTPAGTRTSGIPREQQ